MATIAPFLRIVNKHKAEQPLSVRFTHGAGAKCKVVIATGYKILPNALKNGRVFGIQAKEINDLLHTIQTDLQVAYDSLTNAGRDITTLAMQHAYQEAKVLREGQKVKDRFEKKYTVLDAREKALNAQVDEDEIKAKIQDLQRQLEAQTAVRTQLVQRVQEAEAQDTTQKTDEEELLSHLFTIATKQYEQEDKANKDLLTSYITNYNQRGKNKLSTSTIRIYTSIANLLDRYNHKLRIQDVTRDILQKIEDFMVHEGQLNQTIKAYMGKITAILNYYAPDLNLNPSYKRYKFDLTIAKNDVTFLHPRQLKDFLEYKQPYVGNPNQPNRKSGRAYDRVVDILLLLVSTGLRYSDIFSDFRQLIESELGPNGKQREFIHIIPQKTKRLQIKCKIPVTKLIKEILERNDYKLRKMEDDYFNQLLREYCQDIPSFQQEVTSVAYSGQKEIVTREKLCNSIGSHIGRKTFISYQFALDVPAPEIIGRSGHTDFTTLMLYAQKRNDIKAGVRELDFFALPE